MIWKPNHRTAPDLNKKEALIDPQMEKLSVQWAALRHGRSARRYLVVDVDHEDIAILEARKLGSHYRVVDTNSTPTVLTLYPRNDDAIRASTSMPASSLTQCWLVARLQSKATT